MAKKLAADTRTGGVRRLFLDGEPGTRMLAAMNRVVDVLTSFAASAVVLGTGRSVGKLGARPRWPLELYDFEACPFCRRVREALSVLDLDAIIYPCPRGGPRYRRIVRERGGREQFPYLVDPNTGAEMYESRDIVKYIFATYGDGRVPLLLRGPSFTAPLGVFASAVRLGKGGRALPSRVPEKPLELYSFEASPYCRIAREALSELELAYVVRNVAKGSPKREGFAARSGKMRVPFLVDPNTGREMFESADIVAYVHATYGAEWADRFARPGQGGTGRNAQPRRRQSAGG